MTNDTVAYVVIVEGELQEPLYYDQREALEAGARYMKGGTVSMTNRKIVEVRRIGIKRASPEVAKAS